MTGDDRFTRRLYPVAEAARLVGRYPSTLHTWAHGYERHPEGRRVVKMGPVITALDQTAGDGRSIPFIGLVEASVVQAFRQTGLPMPRIRRALEVLTEQGEREHTLASRQLYGDGADVLYDYARSTPSSSLIGCWADSSLPTRSGTVAKDYSIIGDHIDTLAKTSLRVFSLVVIRSGRSGGRWCGRRGR